MEQSALSTTETSSGGRAKFIIGGLLIFAAVVYLIISSTQASAQYFLTVNEVNAKGEEVYARDLRISGAVRLRLSVIMSHMTATPAAP